MRLAPIHRPTSRSLDRLRAIDASPGVLWLHEPPDRDAATEVARERERVGDAIDAVVRDGPRPPTPSEAYDAIAALARVCDRGGVPHATLARLLDLPVASPSGAPTDLPALPPSPERDGSRRRTPRELAFAERLHDAAGRAIAAFRAGVAAAPYEIRDADSLRSARFLGDLRGRADVGDALDALARRLAGEREHLTFVAAANHTATLGQIEAREPFSPGQERLVETLARGFVTEHVRRAQRATREAASPEARASAIRRTAAEAAARLGVDREPLRLATTYVSEVSAPALSAAIAEASRPASPSEATRRDLDDKRLARRLVETLRHRVDPLARADAALAANLDDFRGASGVERLTIMLSTALMHEAARRHDFAPLAPSRAATIGLLLLQANFHRAVRLGFVATEAVRRRAYPPPPPSPAAAALLAALRRPPAAADATPAGSPPARARSQAPRSSDRPA